MKGRILALVSSVFVFMAISVAGASADDRAEIVPGEIIVGVRPQVDAPSRAVGVFSSIGRATEHHSNLHFYRVGLHPGVSMQAAIASLRNTPGILYAEPNYVLRAHSTPNDPYYASQQYAPQKVQADLAWDIWKPLGQTVIAIVDTGIDNTHPDLVNKIYRDSNGIIGFSAFTGLRDD